MMQKICAKYRWNHSQRMRQMQGVVKNCVFDRSRSFRLRHITAENLCPSTTVVRVTPRRCTGRVYRLIHCFINNIAGSRRWLITVTDLRSGWHQQDWLYGSLLITRTALLAGCAIVVPSVTMRVRNYAGSRIKRGSCWKRSSGWHAICFRYSYNSRTTVQLTQSVARV